MEIKPEGWNLQKCLRAPTLAAISEQVCIQQVYSVGCCKFVSNTN